MIRRLLLAMLLCCAAQCWAVESVRPFVAGSMGHLLKRYEGQPLIVSFWSITCTHCSVELELLGAMKKRHPGLNVVLVATDTPDDSVEAARHAERHGLGKVEQWVFSDPMPERLRAEIDKRWFGELPRTYFYDREHRVEAVSGLVPKARLQQWVRENVR